jgi:hypothetical protein
MNNKFRHVIIPILAANKEMLYVSGNKEDFFQEKHTHKMTVSGCNKFKKGYYFAE